MAAKAEEKKSLTGITVELAVEYLNAGLDSRYLGVSGHDKGGYWKLVLGEGVLGANQIKGVLPIEMRFIKRDGDEGIGFEEKEPYLLKLDTDNGELDISSVLIRTATHTEDDDPEKIRAINILTQIESITSSYSEDTEAKQLLRGGFVVSMDDSEVQVIEKRMGKSIFELLKDSPLSYDMVFWRKEWLGNERGLNGKNRDSVIKNLDPNEWEKVKRAQFKEFGYLESSQSGELSWDWVKEVVEQGNDLISRILKEIKTGKLNLPDVNDDDLKIVRAFAKAISYVKYDVSPSRKDDWSKFNLSMKIGVGVGLAAIPMGVGLEVESDEKFPLGLKINLRKGMLKTLVTWGMKLYAKNSTEKVNNNDAQVDKLEDANFDDAAQEAIALATKVMASGFMDAGLLGLNFKFGKQGLSWKGEMFHPIDNVELEGVEGDATIIDIRKLTQERKLVNGENIEIDFDPVDAKKGMGIELLPGLNEEGQLELSNGLELSVLGSTCKLIIKKDAQYPYGIKIVVDGVSKIQGEEQFNINPEIVGSGVALLAKVAPFLLAKYLEFSGAKRIVRALEVVDGKLAVR